MFLWNFINPDIVTLSTYNTLKPQDTENIQKFLEPSVPWDAYNHCFEHEEPEFHRNGIQD